MVCYNFFMKILIATKNRGKFNEIAGVLRDVSLKDGEGVELGFLGDLKVEDSDFVEDGVTHEENARKKAKYYFERVLTGEVLMGDGSGSDGDWSGSREVRGNSGGERKIPQSFDFVIGEDSGIYVDALAGEMGVQTRRWGAGENATDKKWLEYFMKRMGSLAPGDSDRGAKFVCNACLIGNLDGELIEKCFEGETYGEITHEIGAELLPGLPLSSVFLQDGYDKVYAALSTADKNKISHRGQAIGKVRDFLMNFK